MSENVEKEPKYRDFLIFALIDGWGDIVQPTGYQGNGFQMAGYGIWMIIQHVFFFVVRVIAAIFFPLTAWLLMIIERREFKRQKEEVKRQRDRMFSRTQTVKRASS